MTDIDRIRIPIEGDARKLNAATKSANKGLGSLRGGFGALASSIATLDGPFGGISSRVSAFTSVMLGNNAAVGLAIGSFVALAGVTAAAAKEVAALERAQFKTEALLKATGNASGFTADQMDRMARSTALATLASTEQIRAAQNVLLTFKSISGANFEKTIQLAQDMAAVFGGDAKQAATQLGKALEDPVRGLNALRRSGISFSESQKAVIKSLTETGQKAAAQRKILEALEQQIGGAGKAEAGGISGAFDTLGQRVGEVLEKFGEVTGISPKLVSVLNQISGAIKGADDALTPDSKASQLFQQRLKAELELRTLQARPEGKRSSAANDRIIELQKEIDLLGQQLTIEAQKENRATANKAAQIEAAQEAARQEEAKQKAEERSAFLKERELELQKLAAEAQDSFNKQLEEEKRIREETANIRLARYNDFEEVRQSLLSAEEQENEYHAGRIERLQRFAELNKNMQGSINQVIEQEKARHEAKISEIEYEEQRRRLTFDKGFNKMKLDGLQGTFGNLSTLMNSQSKKMFEIGKKAAIAEAIISTARAAMGAYAALAPIPVVGPALGVAAAAAAVAAGAVQIQQIKSQQFGGGGSVSSAGVGAGAPNTYVPPQPTQPVGAQETEVGGSRPVNIYINNVNGNSAQELLEDLRDHLTNTDFVFIEEGSRQAQVLRGAA